MVSSPKFAYPHALKGMTPVITPSFSSLHTRSVTRQLFSSSSAHSTFPAVGFPKEVFQHILDLSKRFSLLEQVIKISTNDLSHRVSQLEQCIHCIPNNMLAPLIHHLSSDEYSGFSTDCVTPPSRIPCSPILNKHHCQLLLQRRI
ncbi:hypothetical protein D8674_026039 [Pyrus ussuriensis x Pyrus communis]|uniref:Uncharacterized protein n=1 Tax=Pyrus ussuriensis x Pyrus communis TaxID=2448454 RepID=A0A5N5I5Q1_9ROSA|nr:hypothetical protein D8674_026039 [Pyrus ussuriensis x Pyrus communis]